MGEPTAAAFRIIDVMFGRYGLDVDRRHEVARAIDKAAHLPEIREALKIGLRYASEQPPLCPGVREDFAQLTAAIAALEEP